MDIVDRCPVRAETLFLRRLTSCQGVVGDDSPVTGEELRCGAVESLVRRNSSAASRSITESNAGRFMFVWCDIFVWEEVIEE